MGCRYGMSMKWERGEGLRLWGWRWKDYGKMIKDGNKGRKIV